MIAAASLFRVLTGRRLTYSFRRQRFDVSCNVASKRLAVDIWLAIRKPTATCGPIGVAIPTRNNSDIDSDVRQSPR
ncbi:hypothetical protein MPTK1_1g04930 [Marchantia polymorpha subsp. ruderalis]|uniref:Uncharacterized protein n=2 Tax=Marchantia polymorpha TaxID=3197 RepID=A0AAF6ALL5_MARPO|nr:hypothetical protein MARPO_0005s0115 [Marchantia polymorpha]BBM97335.1 hypothetical protein Mp_1g04930 [Marchantia polymorpha subsp. ruderalis]|eukprot:PTQ48472.1 hypothetical protein MARPO_0005s0115 [Marchantia polymorpha]